MSKPKTPPNPGVSSTLWIGPEYILDMAATFSDVAINLADGWVDPLDPKKNVIYTNAVLALELYFKALLVERMTDPAYVKISEGNEFIEVTEEEYLDPEEAIVAIHHSRLVVPKEHQTHDIHALYLSLNEDTRKKIVAEIAELNRSIASEEVLLEFLSKIKNYFVSKRYAFEFYQEAVPVDSNYLFSLIPVLKGVRKALS
ncbi:MULTISPECIES: hypothetical protein [Rahnella]|uniref:hypothetical protein n=1 Tax=Rahnella TaxID=34037 RepID=UPI0018A31E2D|nr:MULTISPECIES: hypothetical protein [Rahnella]MBF7995170.1 hypothetical protein [Rahnella laticis]MBV6819985.1 hypothetical protein [Rahnella sp. PD12R]